MSIFQRAKRSSTKLKLNLGGPSGSGKTYSALGLAKGLVGDMTKVAVLDTENGSAALYSKGIFEGFSTVAMTAPYKPQRFQAAIKAAIDEKFECLIIDSASHEWEATGGCLDIANDLADTKYRGNSYVAWKEVTPMHRAFIEDMLAAPLHIITTVRKKTDYEIVEENGKKKPVKVGLKEVQRDNWEYEFSVSFDIGMNHMATASKDRTSLFSDGIPIFLNEDVGKKLLEWSNG